MYSLFQSRIPSHRSWKASSHPGPLNTLSHLYQGLIQLTAASAWTLVVIPVASPYLCSCPPLSIHPQCSSHPDSPTNEVMPEVYQPSCAPGELSQSTAGTADATITRSHSRYRARAPSHKSVRFQDELVGSHTDSVASRTASNSALVPFAGSNLSRQGSDESTIPAASSTLVSETPPLLPSHLASKTQDDASSFLIRVLLEVLCFTYTVDRFELESALDESGMQMFSHADGSRSLLTHEDKIMAYRLGIIAASAHSRFKQDTYSNLPQKDSLKLVENIIAPAVQLGINPGYFLEKVMEFRTHRCTPGREKESLLFTESSALRFLGCQLSAKRWWFKEQHKCLARRIVTDELVLNRVDMAEEVKTLVVKAIARFMRQYCQYDKTKVPRTIRLDPVTAFMAESLRSDMLESKAPMPLFNQQPSMDRSPSLVDRLLTSGRQPSNSWGVSARACREQDITHDRSQRTTRHPRSGIFTARESIYMQQGRICSSTENLNGTSEVGPTMLGTRPKTSTGYRQGEHPEWSLGR